MHHQRNPRRQNVERGIYFRKTATGRRYEIGFQGSDGRWRWRVVDGGLKEARAARAEVISKLARGERVAPSRRTFAEVADAWIATKAATVRPTTLVRYREMLRLHLAPLGRLRIGEVDEDHAVEVIARMREAGLAGATIRKALVVMSGVLGHAARRGMIPQNPIRRLERGERPPLDRREMRILDAREIAALLRAVGDAYRALLATALFTGLRQGELLGLAWGDVDFAAGTLHVRHQLGRDGELARPKTPQATREVVLAPELARVLRDHRQQALMLGRARREDFVFVSSAGTPMHYRNVVRRGLDEARKAAGLAPEPPLRFHDLRHTFASLLIARGLDIVFVSRQLGHADPSITLRVYAHVFDAEKHALAASDALDAELAIALPGPPPLSRSFPNAPAARLLKRL
jgi:integrase